MTQNTHCRSESGCVVRCQAATTRRRFHFPTRAAVFASAGAAFTGRTAAGHMHTVQSGSYAAAKATAALQNTPIVWIKVQKISCFCYCESEPSEAHNSLHLSAQKSCFFFVFFDVRKLHTARSARVCQPDPPVRRAQGGGALSGRSVVKSRH